MHDGPCPLLYEKIPEINIARQTFKRHGILNVMASRAFSRIPRPFIAARSRITITV